MNAMRCDDGRRRYRRRRKRAVVASSFPFPLFPLSVFFLFLSLQSYLARDDFKRVFGMDKPAFFKAPKWKRVELRKKVGLF